MDNANIRNYFNDDEQQYIILLVGTFSQIQTIDEFSKTIDDFKIDADKFEAIKQKIEAIIEKYNFTSINNIFQQSIEEVSEEETSDNLNIVNNDNKIGGKGVRISPRTARRLATNIVSMVELWKSYMDTFGIITGTFIFFILSMFFLNIFLIFMTMLKDIMMAHAHGRINDLTLKKLFKKNYIIRLVVFKIVDLNQNIASLLGPPDSPMRATGTEVVPAIAQPYVGDVLVGNPVGEVGEAVPVSENDAERLRELRGQYQAIWFEYRRDKHSVNNKVLRFLEKYQAPWRFRRKQEARRAIENQFKTRCNEVNRALELARSPAVPTVPLIVAAENDEDRVVTAVAPIPEEDKSIFIKFAEYLLSLIYLEPEDMFGGTFKKNKQTSKRKSKRNSKRKSKRKPKTFKKNKVCKNRRI